MLTNFAILTAVNLNAKAPPLYSHFPIEKPISEIILPTSFPGLSIIPANLELQEYEYDTPLAMQSGNEGKRFFTRLGKAQLEIDDRFDVVVIDCPPQLEQTFYEAWRLAIQRYGIYNPYTGRGASKGVLPHGSHNVRDVLATHILKQTGSYEQASYAIQDTADRSV